VILWNKVCATAGSLSISIVHYDLPLRIFINIINQLGDLHGQTRSIASKRQRRDSGGRQLEESHKTTGKWKGYATYKLQTITRRKDYQRGLQITRCDSPYSICQNTVERETSTNEKKCIQAG